MAVSSPGSFTRWEKASGTDKVGELVGLRAAVDALHKRKISGPEGSRNIIPRSHSPYSQYRILYSGFYKTGIIQNLDWRVLKNRATGLMGQSY